LEFVSLQDSHAHFDFNMDGHREATAWVGGGDGILVHDANNDHLVNNASEISFADPAHGANTDLEGIRALFDSNHDGVLDSHDAEFAHFGVWVDSNGNGISEPGEYHSLADLGIPSLNLTTDGHIYSAANGDVLLMGQGTFTHTDGS